MHLRGGVFLPFDCPVPGCGKKFRVLGDVEAEEVEVMGMDMGRFESWGKGFSSLHWGMHWGSAPLLPYKYIWVDTLHLFLNLFNVAFDETVDFFLQHEHVSSENTSLIHECDAIAGQVNAVLARAGICARFGTAERKAFCGNDLRALMMHPSALPDLLACVRPLYIKMEPMSFAADASKARKTKERLEKLADEVGKPKKKKARVDADDFDDTAGISAAAANRNRKQQAALKAASDNTKTFEDKFEAHVNEMTRSVEGNYNWRVVNTLTALVEFYEFVHAKQWLADALAADAEEAAKGGGGGERPGRGAHVLRAVSARREACKDRARLLVSDVTSTVGVAREQTYVHDLLYGLHRVFDTVLHILLAGMQGCEHVNKQMKMVLNSQCTAANNNRRDAQGNRMLSDVSQVAVGMLMRQHIVESPNAGSLPSNQYGQRIMGQLAWGTKESHARALKGEHRGFTACATAGLHALRDGTHVPVAAAAASPEPMAVLLSQPSRIRRFAHRTDPSPLVPPDVVAARK